MLWILVISPIVLATMSLLTRADGIRRSLLVAGATIELVLAVTAWMREPAPILNGWLAMDPTGKLFLTIASVLFFSAAVYSVGYLRAEKHGKQEDFVENGQIFSNASEAVFSGCLLYFLGTMNFVILSQHFGLLWVAMEGTTLASAPLIYFHRHHRSLEATWKYLLVCSVGIAVALLGNFFLATAASNGTGSLVLGDLVKEAGILNIPWVKAAFIFFLVGYGTKMGLAPMHTWLPDAHSEAPSVVSALLSGALLNCAFVGILRAMQVCTAAGEAEFARDLMVLLGLVSMGVAAAFVIGQSDYKRLLAYSSVEHMGILALGVGLGGTAVFGSMLHAVNHSLTKAALFFAAGNILTAYKTKSSSDVRGVLSVLPASGVLWVAGILSITGFPPFGTFLSEFTILKASIDQGRIWIAVLYLALLAAIFVGISTTAFKMAQGRPGANPSTRRHERILCVLPPAVLAGLVLVLGLYVPPALSNVLEQIAAVLK